MLWLKIVLGIVIYIIGAMVTAIVIRYYDRKNGKEDWDDDSDGPIMLWPLTLLVVSIIGGLGIIKKKLIAITDLAISPKKRIEYSEEEMEEVDKFLDSCRAAEIPNPDGSKIVSKID